MLRFSDGFQTVQQRLNVDSALYAAFILLSDVY